MNLVLDKLTKTYKDIVVVDNVSMELKPGL